MSASFSVIGFILLLWTGVLRAQTPPRPVFDTFEIAAIKPTPADWTGGRYIRMLSAHQLAARNHALKALLAAAYDLSPQAIFGVPKWSDSAHYDILAKTPGDVRPVLNEQMAMLRNLLTDRFRLVFHREPKEMPVYALTVAKGGSRLKVTTRAPDATPEGPPRWPS